MEIHLPPIRKIINRSFEPLFFNQDRYLILWGGRGSSKSNFAAKKLIYRCLTAPYFRCILIRATYATIKDSQYQTIKDIITEWKLLDFFQFKENPLEIKCINGNIFYARGCDDVQKIKSIKDPSAAWYEEGNEIDKSDFITITTSIRTSKADYLQEIFSFNPECEGDAKDFWINQMFFNKQSGKYFRADLEIEMPNGKILKTPFTAHHSTYHDNRWCTPEFIAFLEQLKLIDPYYYEVFCKGEWGHKQVKNPFALTFSEKKHCGKCEYDGDHEVYLSFDFNRDPVTCLSSQYINGQKRWIKEFALENSDIYALCDVINNWYPYGVFVVTGDATGRARTAISKGNINYFDVVKQQLNLIDTQMRQPSINPSVRDSRVLVNSFLQFGDCVIDPDGCPQTIADLKYVEVDSNGDVIKDRSKEFGKVDLLDCLRYDLNTFHGDFIKYFKFREGVTE